jgi:Holliday junction resolvasome RuvABC endonuclease subunit
MKVHTLGLDISSSKIGIAVVDRDKKIITSDVIKLRSDSSLEQRALMLENKLIALKKHYLIESINVEEPFIAFGGGKTTAQTMAILQRFNGMCCYTVYKVFEKEPKMVSVRSARSKLGIKIPKGTAQKDSKKFIIEYVSKNHPEFQYNLTVHGNPQPGTDDRADAIVIALSTFEN